METRIEKVDRRQPDHGILRRAADILVEGGLVAFPTETVYGLGANALNPQAVKRIFKAKGRPSDNPLIVHIGDEQDLGQLVAEIPEVAIPLMKAFWPGPLTLVFSKSNIVPQEITAGLSTVAIRWPINVVAQKLIQIAGIPIAAPSANTSGRPSPTRASHVAFDLDGKIPMIIDGGPAEVGLESTVLDITGERPMILRPGSITKEMIEQIIGTVEIDPSIMQKPLGSMIPKAPGMKYTHYAPKAAVTIVEGELLQVVAAINDLVKEKRNQETKVGIMATEQTKDLYENAEILSVGDRSQPETIAANLFSVLRKFDYMGVEYVYAEAFPQTQVGTAIMNRLQKAAGYNIIQI